MENNLFKTPLSDGAFELFMDNDFYIIPEIIVAGYTYSGNYSKRILFIVNDNMSENAAIQFSRICSFAKLSNNDFALINLKNNADSNLEKIINDFKPVKMLMFGVNPTPTLPVREGEVSEALKFFSASSLNELFSDIEIKKAQTPMIVEVLK